MPRFLAASAVVPLAACGGRAIPVGDVTVLVSERLGLGNDDGLSGSLGLSGLKRTWHAVKCILNRRYEVVGQRMRGVLAPSAFP